MTTVPTTWTILAAIDNSAAARPVLAAAVAVAPFSRARVRAFHVRSDGDHTAHNVATAAKVELVETTGDPVQEIIEAARAADVAVVVLGTHGIPESHHVGHVAAAVLVQVEKPVVVVPPEAQPIAHVRRVLVPLAAEPRTARSLQPAIQHAAEAHLDVVLLHVFSEESIPSFSDHEYETESWIHEFAARYAPIAPHNVRIELRVGDPADTVLEVAREIGADLIALGWSLDLSPGHASVVRTVLERGHVPVALVPLDATTSAI